MVPYLSGGRDFDSLPKHALLAALPLVCLETPASGLRSASAAPFTGKTRAQSWDALLGRSTVARVLRREPG